MIQKNVCSRLMTRWHKIVNAIMFLTTIQSNNFYCANIPSSMGRQQKDIKVIFRNKEPKLTIGLPDI